MKLLQNPVPKHIEGSEPSVVKRRFILYDNETNYSVPTLAGIEL